jgi:hypothetical protein
MGPELSGTPWVHPIGGQRCSPSRLALQRCDQVVAVARADAVGLYAFICGYQELDLTWPFGAHAAPALGLGRTFQPGDTGDAVAMGHTQHP